MVDVAAYKGVLFYAHRHQLWQLRLNTDFHSLVADLTKSSDLIEPVDVHSLSPIRKLAVDWENQRVYILTGTAVILVNFFGKGINILSHRGNITGIAVDPVQRYFFYSESGVVQRVHLDGTSTPHRIFRALTVDFDRNVQGGEALTLDPNIRRLYYIHQRVLYSFDYDGGSAVVISTQAPYAKLEPFEDRLYASFRAFAHGLVSLHRTGYTFRNRPSTDSDSQGHTVAFHETRPRSMSVVHIAKFPGSQKTARPCFGSEVCRSGWCFPVPEPGTSGHRCLCQPNERDPGCVRLVVHDFLPRDAVLSEQYNSGAVWLRPLGWVQCLPAFCVLAVGLFRAL